MSGISERQIKPGSTVVVGMSGGVDSSVAAALLKAQGHRVIGLFMKNWDSAKEQMDTARTGARASCTSEEDYADVARVCDKLEIPHYAVNLTQEYWDGVFKEFVRDYQAGHTPNPDILCNREIKFKVFLDEALKLGADYLATGHYARTTTMGDGTAGLARAVDAAKDQTYFLYTLGAETLSRVLFPLGEIEKPKVREIAREIGLATHAKKDSTGVCFIGERDFPMFLSQYVKGSPGKFVMLDGAVVGTHSGAQFYTLGQRRGLGLGGPGERWFVVGKNIERNEVIVERGEKHPALFSDALVAVEESFVNPAFKLAVGQNLRCTAKVRYRQPDQDCTVTRSEDGKLHVAFDLPQRAIAPRQSIVFYDGEICLGGAIIERAAPSYFERNLPLPAHVGA